MPSDGDDVPFTLPRGFRDGEGQIHRHGRMRLATAKDEVAPLQDHRVRANPAYLTVILLSRVITRLGELEQVYPQVIEGLPVADFAYLQALYRRINGENGSLEVACPECGKVFDAELELAGESLATP